MRGKPVSRPWLVRHGLVFTLLVLLVATGCAAPATATPAPTAGEVQTPQPTVAATASAPQPTSAETSTSAATAKKGGILRTVSAWGNLVKNFNPLFPGGNPTPGTRSALYEPLFYFNNITGKETPLLGVSYTWKDNNLTLEVKTREGVLWNDGQPFSADDVAFTFNYLKQFPQLDTGRIWQTGLSSVEATDANTVVFKLSTPFVPIFNMSLGTQLIVPKHIWESIKDPATYDNPNPVGTGPFLVKSFDPQAIIYERNPKYWMPDKPYVDQVVMQAVNSNDSQLLSLLGQEADFGYMGIGHPETAFVAKDPEHNKIYWPVTNYNLLYFNLLKKPFNDPAFRQAVAYAIDTASAADKAYGPTVKAGSPSLIIPSQIDQWLDPANKANFYSYDPAKAKSILEGAGYKWGSSGELILPSGEAMPAMNILVGSGWTDFITIAQVITENLKQIGITANIDQEAWNTYISSLMSGTYDTAICWGMTSGSTPFPMLYYTFGGSFYAPEGKTANANYARYKNDTVDKALGQFASTTDPAVQKQAINTVVGQLLQDLPVVVLTERTNFSCYTTWTFTGWPSTDDPYNDGAALDTPGSGEMVLLNVHQK